MCLLCMAIGMRNDLPLIIMGNRDEYYDRPTMPSHFWPPQYELLAGKDLAQGGTWLGITRTGRFGAVLNFREKGQFKGNAPSRGGLLLDFLFSNRGAYEFIKRLEGEAHNYNGFNLVVGSTEALWWFSNRGGFEKLQKGIYAISNHLLNTPWPKVKKVMKIMSEVLSKDVLELKRCLLEALMDGNIAPDHELPDTGVSLEWERVLSPIFVKSSNYGTRSSHLIFVHRDKKVEFFERVYERGLHKQDREFVFYLRH